MTNINKLKEALNKDKIVIFTGAGISVPSGIPDFRSANGLYNEKTKLNISPEDIISHSFFYSHTKEFYEFYKTKMVYPKALPNLAHKYFKELGEIKDVTIVTQNIDGLDKMAGSKKVYEIHGTIHRNFCTKCNKEYGLDKIIESEGVPYCSCGGIIKPDVVLYEEPLDDYTVTKALKAIADSDTLVVIGTSLAVYPAASYIRYFKGDNLILINKTKTQYDNIADLVINDDIINVIKELKKVA